MFGTWNLGHLLDKQKDVVTAPAPKSRCARAFLHFFAGLKLLGTGTDENVCALAAGKKRVGAFSHPLWIARKTIRFYDVWWLFLLLESRSGKRGLLWFCPLAIGYVGSLIEWNTFRVTDLDEIFTLQSPKVWGFRLRVPLRPSQLAVPIVVAATAVGGAENEAVKAIDQGPE